MHISRLWKCAVVGLRHDSGSFPSRPSLKEERLRDEPVCVGGKQKTGSQQNASSQQSISSKQNTTRSYAPQSYQSKTLKQRKHFKLFTRAHQANKAQATSALLSDKRKLKPVFEGRLFPVFAIQMLPERPQGTHTLIW